MKIAASIDELKKYLKDLSECNFDKLNNVYFKQCVHREKVVRIAIMTGPYLGNKKFTKHESHV